MNDRKKADAGIKIVYKPDNLKEVVWFTKKFEKKKLERFICFGNSMN